MDEKEMKNRTKRFAKDVILLCRGLPNNQEGRLISGQLFRAGTSVGSNYRASCRARSRAEFIAKLGIVEEEADESMFWMEIMKEMQILEGKEINRLYKEANEILAIVVSSIKTARKNK